MKPEGIVITIGETRYKKVFNAEETQWKKPDKVDKIIKNVIDLFAKNFDPEGGHIMLPDCFARVISSDATFETVSSNLSRKLKLRRKDKSVGAKTILYVVDSAKNDNETKEIRAIVSNFFKKNLGFTQAEIIAIDRGAFIKDGEFWKPKFGRGL